MSLPRVIPTVSLGALPLVQALDVTTSTILKLRDSLRLSRHSNDHRTADLCAALLDDLTNIRTRIGSEGPTANRHPRPRPRHGSPPL